jgi:hypothetical protein
MVAGSKKSNILVTAAGDTHGTMTFTAVTATAHFTGEWNWVTLATVHLELGCLNTEVESTWSTNLPGSLNLGNQCRQSLAGA